MKLPTGHRNNVQLIRNLCNNLLQTRDPKQATSICNRIESIVKGLKSFYIEAGLTQGVYKKSASTGWPPVGESGMEGL